jgi:hypothetical protein
MLSRVFISAVTLYCAATAVYAGEACDKTRQEYRDCVRLVDSLRPDKAGQMRVFAADGSEYYAGQVQLMKEQLRKYEKLCATGTPADEAEAQKVLESVEQLLKSHHRNS